MWDEILEDYDLTPDTVDMKESFFVGDAAGRIAVPGTKIKEDFSDSDRQAPSTLLIPPLLTHPQELRQQRRDPLPHARRVLSGRGAK